MIHRQLMPCDFLRIRLRLSVSRITKSVIANHKEVPPGSGCALGDNVPPASIEWMQQRCAPHDNPGVKVAVQVEDRVVAYAVRIVRATRRHSGIAVGAGPRGAIALVRAGRAAALMDGRDFATPDDIKAMALPALRHRILLSPTLEIEGLQEDDALAEILATVEAPRS